MDSAADSDLDLSLSFAYTRKADIQGQKDDGDDEIVTLDNEENSVGNEQVTPVKNITTTTSNFPLASALRSRRADFVHVVNNIRGEDLDSTPNSKAVRFADPPVTPGGPDDESSGAGTALTLLFQRWTPQYVEAAMMELTKVVERLEKEKRGWEAIKKTVNASDLPSSSSPFASPEYLTAEQKQFLFLTHQTSSAMSDGVLGKGHLDFAKNRLDFEKMQNLYDKLDSRAEESIVAIHRTISEYNNLLFAPFAQHGDMANHRNVVADLVGESTPVKSQNIHPQMASSGQSSLQVNMPTASSSSSSATTTTTTSTSTTATAHAHAGTGVVNLVPLETAAPLDIISPQSSLPPPVLGDFGVGGFSDSSSLDIHEKLEKT